MSNIPRIAFQIYLDGRVPEELYQSHTSMKHNLKKCDHRLYTDRDNLTMLEDNLPQYVNLYRNSDDSNKKVIAAYAWLYYHGGLYMDPDLVLRSENTPYLTDGSEVFILRCSYPTRSLSPYLMASAEKCGFWLNTLDLCLIGERHAPEWSYEVDPESVTAYKNFNSLASGEPLDEAYRLHGNRYDIVILEYDTLCDRYLHSIRAFKNKNPAAWRHVDYAKWIYIAGAIIIMVLILVLIALFFYDSWRIANKAREYRDKECKKLRSVEVQ